MGRITTKGFQSNNDGLFERTIKISDTEKITPEILRDVKKADALLETSFAESEYHNTEARLMAWHAYDDGDIWAFRAAFSRAGKNADMLMFDFIREVL